MKKVIILAKLDIAVAYLAKIPSLTEARYIVVFLDHLDAILAGTERAEDGINRALELVDFTDNLNSALLRECGAIYLRTLARLAYGEEQPPAASAA